MDKREKKTFFDELYCLDDESDGPEEKSNANEILAKTKLTAIRKGSLRAIDGLHSNQALLRTVSAPIARSNLSFPGSSAPCNPTHNVANLSNIHPPVEHNLIETSEPSASPSLSMAAKGGKKRKRGQSFNALPDSQQIFKGLSFYFFPNNDVAPARAFRIRKAMEWGAVWIKTWKAGITHVVADKNLSYKDLLVYLKIQSLPKDIVVVNEDYPADCIRFRFVVNPKQSHYLVRGYEEPKQPSPATRPSSSDISLQLKPDRNEAAQVPQTSSQSNGSTNPVPLSNNSKDDRDPDVTHISDSMPSSIDQKHHDALSEAIEEAQAIGGLPIDLEDAEDNSDNVDNGDYVDINEDKDQQFENTSKQPLASNWQQNFSCMKKNDGTSHPNNPNKRTIEVLQQMAHYYDTTKDQWRTVAYRKAITALKKQKQLIGTAEEAFAIPSIGQRLADKIEEIVSTNRLRRLKSTKLDANDEVLQKFTKIYGVGYAQATRWIEQGHRTVDDLLSKVKLTKNQKIGIEHLEDFQSRIPRHEMNQHNDFVRETVGDIDADIQFTIGGSFRRGQRDSGDIDFIVTKPDRSQETLRIIMAETLIPYLFAKGYLKVALATSNNADGSKWHGACALPGNTVWRRIDFLFVPWNELGAALIYFTGNDIFNRSIRLLASKKGMRLNQHGLWKDVFRGKSRERITQGTLVEGRDEKKIFELLGVPWRPPEHRIC